MNISEINKTKELYFSKAEEVQKKTGLNSYIH